MFCGSHTLTASYHDHANISVLRCRRWSCDECLPSRLWQLRGLAASGEPTRFLTLTSRYGSADTPDEAAVRLVHAFRMLVQKAVRYGFWTRPQYLAVLEATKNGWPHLHVLMRAEFIPQRWISRQMAEWIDSPVVDISAIKSRRHASRYIAKYVSKGPMKFTGCKRYWRSQSYVQADGEERSTACREKPTCWRQRASITYLYAWYAEHWGGVEWTGKDRFRAEAKRSRPPPEWEPQNMPPGLARQPEDVTDGMMIVAGRESRPWWAR